MRSQTSRACLHGHLACNHRQKRCQASPPPVEWFSLYTIMQGLSCQSSTISGRLRSLAAHTSQCPARSAVDVHTISGAQPPGDCAAAGASSSTTAARTASGSIGAAATSARAVRPQICAPASTRALPSKIQMRQQLHALQPSGHTSLYSRSALRETRMRGCCAMTRSAALSRRLSMRSTSGL